MVLTLRACVSRSSGAGQLDDVHFRYLLCLTHKVGIPFYLVGLFPLGSHSRECGPAV